MRRPGGHARGQSPTAPQNVSTLDRLIAAARRSAPSRAGCFRSSSTTVMSGRSAASTSPRWPPPAQKSTAVGVQPLAGGGSSRHAQYSRDSICRRLRCARAGGRWSTWSARRPATRRSSCPSGRSSIYIYIYTHTLFYNILVLYNIILYHMIL